MTASRQSYSAVAAIMTAGTTKALVRRGITMDTTCEIVFTSREVTEATWASRFASNQPSGRASTREATRSIMESHTS